MNKELNKTKDYIMAFLETDNLEKDIDSQIASFERNIMHLKQKAGLENSPG